mmetsp:Transcript_4906/g.17791  ORF Transcript_4906/g.17791 Transcript_4906/m.17791 type:complete len:499 (-) Transcript_4906:767-2263(-)
MALWSLWQRVWLSFAGKAEDTRRCFGPDEQSGSHRCRGSASHGRGDVILRSRQVLARQRNGSVSWPTSVVDKGTWTRAARTCSICGEISSRHSPRPSRPLSTDSLAKTIAQLAMFAAMNEFLGMLSFRGMGGLANASEPPMVTSSKDRMPSGSGSASESDSCSSMPSSPPSYSDSDSEAYDLSPGIAFPGGGLFFWWQLGAVQFLQEHVDLTEVPMLGASCGALAAALSSYGVPKDAQLELAYRLCVEHQVFERPAGLAGVWGKLIRSWLDELLPDSPRAIEQAKGKLHILVLVQKYPVPIVGLKRECFSEYHSKEDLIECLMASVHIPYFIDGCFYNKFRGASCVDGSPMLRKEELHIPHGDLAEEEEPTAIEDLNIDDANTGHRRLASISSSSKLVGPPRPKRRRPMVILDWRYDTSLSQSETESAPHSMPAEEVKDGWRRRLPLVGAALQLPPKGTEREWLNSMVAKGYRYAAQQHALGAYNDLIAAYPLAGKEA